ncbi:MAG: UDP-N-acetylglucosamine 1-carboxyvinyltransferase, partial [bacterium]
VVKREDDLLIINADNLHTCEAPYDLVRKMRASFYVMGPLLARLGEAKVSIPGGCAIGSRPIDLHLKGFAALGAEVVTNHGCISTKCSKLVGEKVYLDFPSVGATENIMMAACLAEGTTTLENAAKEPEIVDLANFLNSMGAKVRGAGTDVIKIEGVQELRGIRYAVIPDRVEAGTFMVAAAMAQGDILVKNVVFDHLKPVTAKLREAGVSIIEEEGNIRVTAKKRCKAVNIKTLPYPGFPTDMQAQFMALLAVASGTSVVTETVFENRFMHADELKRMGSNIKIEGHTAVINGVRKLAGAPVKATDLRAGAALILAGMVAEGETEITNIEYIDRGYYRIEDRLRSIGVNIKRIEK